MQTIEKKHHLPNCVRWLTLVVIVIGLFLQPLLPQPLLPQPLLPQPLWAQTDDPAVLPLPAADELVVVAGGYGATLYKADGVVAATATAGERLVASARSADNEWLLVRTADDVEGWAQRRSLLLFERLALTMIDLDVSAMNAAATAAIEETDENSTDSVSSTTRDATENSDVENSDAESGVADGADLAAVAGISALVRTGEQRLNVRSGPGTAYPVIGKAVADTTVTVIGRNDDPGWLQIQQADLPGGFGWVATDFVALSAPSNDLPLVDAVNRAAVATAALPTGMANGAAATTMPSAQPAALRGKLVLIDRNSGQIYLYHLATGALQPLTTGNDPALSPDGNWIVFTRSGGENGIYLIDSNGANEQRIFAERELLRSPKWSPDGNWIVFSRGDEFNRCYLDEDTGECLRFTPFVTEGLATGKDHIRKLARIDRNGNNYRDLAVVPDAFAPDWGNGGIVYQSAAGLQITEDTPEDNNRLLYFEIRRQYHQDPDWQPGGGRIVFQQRQGSHYEIFAINRDGTGLTALTRPATALVDQLPSNVSPAWSPDGQSIVFLSNRTANGEAGAWRLWVMNADGSNQRPLPIDLPLHYDYALEQMVDWAP